MIDSRTVDLVIPALNEAGSIAGVVSAVDRSLVDTIIVVDNGSTDGTPDLAREAGARVVFETRRGYGSACFRGARESTADIVVFMDADGSDDPAEIPRILEAMANRDAQLVIGSRNLGGARPGSLTLTQVVGNRLVCLLMRLLWSARYTDLGPMRAVTRDALLAMDMQEMGFGWTVEMQVKAAQAGMTVAEISVPYHPRTAGDSKISGNLLAGAKAGAKILGYLGEAKISELLR